MSLAKKEVKKCVYISQTARLKGLNEFYRRPTIGPGPERISRARARVRRSFRAALILAATTYVAEPPILFILNERFKARRKVNPPTSRQSRIYFARAACSHDPRQLARRVWSFYVICSLSPFPVSSLSVLFVNDDGYVNSFAFREDHSRISARKERSVSPRKSQRRSADHLSLCSTVLSFLFDKKI